MRPLREKTSPARKGRNPRKPGLRRATCRESSKVLVATNPRVGTSFLPSVRPGPFRLCTALGRNLPEFAKNRRCVETEHLQPIAKGPGSSPGHSTLYVTPLPGFHSARFRERLCARASTKRTIEYKALDCQSGTLIVDQLGDLFLG